MSILSELTDLAEALDNGLAAVPSDLPVYPLPGATGAQARRLVLYPPALTWKADLDYRDPMILADWTVPATLHAAGPSAEQVRQLYDDLDAVLAAVGTLSQWRVTAAAPSVLADTQGGTPVYTLTLER